MSTQAQLESYEEVKLTREILHKKILDVLDAHPEGLTAFEIAPLIGRATRQDVAPRLTELRHLGLVYPTHEKRINPETGRNGQVYIATWNLEKWLSSKYGN